MNDIHKSVEPEPQKNSDRNLYYSILISMLKEGSTPGKHFRMRVISGSMRPMIRVGDILLVEPVKVEKLMIGDIILLERSGMAITHRLVSVKGTTLRTKGDAAWYLDLPVISESVLGKVTRVEPEDGRVIDLIKSPLKQLNRLIGTLQSIMGFSFINIAGLKDDFTSPPKRSWRLRLSQLIFLPLRGLTYLLEFTARAISR